MIRFCIIFYFPMKNVSKRYKIFSFFGWSRKCELKFNVYMRKIFVEIKKIEKIKKN